VAGAGPERASLQRRVCELGVAARLVGEQTGEARAALLAAADLLVLPSRVLPDGRTESAPLVLLEAMAAGLPVVATRVGGNAELIVDGENGLLVEPGAPAPLRAAIIRLLDDPELRARLVAAGRNTARAHAWSSVGPRLHDLLFRGR
jgi:glycosyltransferase involved in cell wall biosynthesis